MDNAPDVADALCALADYIDVEDDVNWVRWRGNCIDEAANLILCAHFQERFEKRPEISRPIEEHLRAYPPTHPERKSLLLPALSHLNSGGGKYWMSRVIRNIGEAARAGTPEGLQSGALRAQRIRLFPNGCDDIDVDLRDLIIKLESDRPTKSDIEIARELFHDDKKAKRMLGRVRAYRQSGKTTLPPRA